jgi:hypothetical protein
MAGRRLEALRPTDAEQSELMALAARPKTAQALALRADHPDLRRRLGKQGCQPSARCACHDTHLSDQPMQHCRCGCHACKLNAHKGLIALAGAAIGVTLFSLIPNRAPPTQPQIQVAVPRPAPAPVPSLPPPAPEKQPVVAAPSPPRRSWRQWCRNPFDYRWCPMFRRVRP